MSRQQTRMPALFLGHGSPMNALEDNAFSRTWARLGSEIPKPLAILCVSAHWETPGVKLTTMAQPRTIHDFHGFPPELFQLRYPAPGSPQLAERIRSQSPEEDIQPDHDWGLDHGCWSLLCRLYPKAEIPVLQLSLDRSKSPAEHFRLARKLRYLRGEGVLILGSGNIVHNLGALIWADQAHDWALRFDARVRDLIRARDMEALIDYSHIDPSAKLAVPSAEHYLPLLYVLAQWEPEDSLNFLTEKVTLGAISMRSLRIG